MMMTMMKAMMIKMTMRGMMLLFTCQKDKLRRGQNCANLSLELCATLEEDIITFEFWLL